MIVELSRLLITLTTTALGFLVGRSVVAWWPQLTSDVELATITGAIIGAGVGYVAGGGIGRLVSRSLDRAPQLLHRTTGPELFAGAFGVLVGLAVGLVVSIPIVALVPEIVGWPLATLVIVVAVAFGARVFSARSQDLLTALGLRGRDPVRFSKTLPDESAVRSYIIDSAAAIDGRILELARSGLMVGAVSVPEFVVDELQGIADAGDRSRRRRGRRGLDVLDALRDVPSVDFLVVEETVPEQVEVDAKLLTLAARSESTLVTSDHNLAKAAELRGILVLNPHSLGESLRPQVQAGELIRIRIEKQGSEAGQGVGYLDDGTMVVLEGGAARVGETVDVEIANTLRTSVGRLLFAKLPV
ncbi:MAG: TRAM domain-containing protein [Acidimicrobiia bacterium]|nr:TRAM domain-containing protein [Acidimicrobiia bacterium]